MTRIKKQWLYMATAIVCMMWFGGCGLIAEFWGAIDEPAELRVTADEPIVGSQPMPLPPLSPSPEPSSPAPESAAEPDGPSFYVHGDGNDDVHDGLTVDAPFLTLEKAYMTALANPQYTRIVVLSDIAADKAIVLVGAPNQPILIKGNGAGNIKIERSGGTGDSVLAIEGGAQVKLENITINGKANGSYRALKTAGNTTKVTLGNGAVLTGQITGSGLSAATVADGSGILICDNAEVEITGTGTVTGCAETGTRAKGAVVVIGGGKLTMNGGEISHNTATGTGGSFHGALGGGVHVSGGMFTMNAGVISGNKAISSDAETNAYAFGGGVYIRSGSMFTMNGGVISDNEALNNANGSDHCAFAGRLLSMAAHLS